MSKIAGVVILYNPDSDVKLRICTYLNHIDRLYIIVNSENPQSLSLYSEKIIYHADGTNKGIAARLNQAALMAIDEKFDWLLTMDQDSYFNGGAFTNLLACLEDYLEKDSVAMFGSQYTDAGMQSSACSPVLVKHLITSGSLINLHLFPTVGAFDEALFIDQVDSEFCYRAILKNYKIVQFNNIYLKHNLGKQSIHRSIKNFQKTSRSLHSPLRLYYMTRNYFYVRAKYRKFFPDEIDELRKDLLTRIKNNLLYDYQRVALLKHIVSGIIDYNRKKMGKKN